MTRFPVVRSSTFNKKKKNVYGRVKLIILRVFAPQIYTTTYCIYVSVVCTHNIEYSADFT